MQEVKKALISRIKYLLNEKSDTFFVFCLTRKWLKENKINYAEVENFRDSILILSTNNLKRVRYLIDKKREITQFIYQKIGVKVRKISVKYKEQ